MLAKEIYNGDYCYYVGADDLTYGTVPHLDMDRKYKYIKLYYQDYGDVIYVYYEGDKYYSFTIYDFNRYFISIEEYRNIKINQIIDVES